MTTNTEGSTMELMKFTNSEDEKEFKRIADRIWITDHCRVLYNPITKDLEVVGNDNRHWARYETFDAFKNGEDTQ